MSVHLAEKVGAGGNIVYFIGHTSCATGNVSVCLKGSNNVIGDAGAQ